MKTITLDDWKTYKLVPIEEEPIKEIVPSERGIYSTKSYYVGRNSDIQWHIDDETRNVAYTNCTKNRNIVPRREQAEAILALCQLLQLRDETWRRDNDWKPVDVEYTLSIIFIDGKIETDCGWANELLCFSSVKIRDEFLEKHRALIEKLLYLYV